MSKQFFDFKLNLDGVSICGLKTRKWPEVKQSLKNMVEAVNIIKKGEAK